MVDNDSAMTKNTVHENQSAPLNVASDGLASEGETSDRVASYSTAAQGAESANASIDESATTELAKPILRCGVRKIEINVTSHPYSGPCKPGPDFKRGMTARYMSGRLAVYAALKLTSGYRIEGVENIPATGPAIIVCNHQALLDPPFIAMAVNHRQICFMAKQELRKIPFVGWILEGCRCVWVDRQARDGKALQGARRILEAGDLLGIFPEGTRSKDGNLLPARGGAATLALETGAVVVPAAVYNTMNIMTGKCPWGKGPAGVRFGKPLYFDKEAEPSRERIQEVKNELMWHISQLMEKGMP